MVMLLQLCPYLRLYKKCENFSGGGGGQNVRETYY
jgi:hypothetical protein